MNLIYVEKKTLIMVMTVNKLSFKYYLGESIIRRILREYREKAKKIFVNCKYLFYILNIN